MVGHDESGSALMGVLLVVTILGVLGGLALLSTNLGWVGGQGSLASEGTVPTSPASPPARAARPTPFGAAVGASCTADEKSVETAAAVAAASSGAPAASVAQLVAGRWLDHVPGGPGYTIELETAGGRGTGRVLVNGKPGAAGCPGQPGAG